MQAATPNSCPQLVCKDFWQMTSVFCQSEFRRRWHAHATGTSAFMISYLGIISFPFLVNLTCTACCHASFTRNLISMLCQEVISFQVSEPLSHWAWEYNLETDSFKKKMKKNDNSTGVEAWTESETELYLKNWINVINGDIFDLSYNWSL